MKRTYKIILGLVILALVVINIIRNNEFSSTKSEQIIIGSILSLSGPGVSDGESLKKGFDLALSDLKEKGLNINLIYHDDETDPKNTVSGVHALGAKGAQALVGFNWDFLYNSAIPVSDMNQVVTMTPSNSSEYTTNSNYGFTIAPKTSDSERVLVNFIKENNIKRISFLANKFAWSDVHLVNLEKAAEKAGAQIVSKDWMQFGQEKDVINTVIPKIKEINPDLIFIISAGDEALSTLFNRIQQSKLKIPMVVGTSAVSRFLENNPHFLSKEYPLYSLVPHPSSKFISYFKKETGEYPGEYTEYAYDTIMVLAQALKENGNKDLKEYLESHSFDGFSRDYSFDENHDATKGEWQLRKDN